MALFSKCPLELHLTASSSSSLDLFDNHIDSLYLPLSTLLDGFTSSELPLALQALSSHAATTGNTTLANRIQCLHDERKALASEEAEVVDELTPVLEVSMHDTPY